MTLALIAGILAYAARERTPAGQAATIPPAQPAPTLETPPVTEDWPRWGVTHTQFSADNEHDEVIVAAAAHILDREPLIQNQHIMGWGADNPEPAPGRYDFRSLDRRVKFMAKSQSIPVITLCCSPDWMKGGDAGRTDWDQIEVAPEREHFDDYAKLAATVARRYPTIKHFMVWNEFKGFWNDTRNEWDAALYTELYNKVYDALKAVDEDIKIGGPYLPIDSHAEGERTELSGPWGKVDQRALDAIRYWIANKKGADYIVVDGSAATKDRGLIPDEFGALGKFSAITTWLRRESGNMPVWWAEWYVEPEGLDWTEARRTAVQTAALIEFAVSGVTTALYWNPQREAGRGDIPCPGCLWRPGKGSEMPMAGVLKGFTKWFPAHAELTTVTPSDKRVRVLAQARQMVLVNTADAEVTVTVDEQEFTLKPYEVRWSDRGAA
ncbi:GH39 family glycosyl hydrolase [Streptosporangium soli]|nr:xylan 1,4-beta-xylosidase [Streptosporangium sp. KLBMP 9127]